MLGILLVFIFFGLSHCSRNPVLRSHKVITLLQWWIFQADCTGTRWRLRSYCSVERRLRSHNCLSGIVGVHVGHETFHWTTWLAPQRHRQLCACVPTQASKRARVSFQLDEELSHPRRERFDLTALYLPLDLPTLLFEYALLLPIGDAVALNK